MQAEKKSSFVHPWIMCAFLCAGMLTAGVSSVSAQPASQGCPAGGAGDECSDPIVVTEGFFNADLSDNTGSTGDDTTCASGDTIDEWYCYTASCDGVARASTCGFSTPFDATLAVFDACGGNEIKCNDQESDNNDDLIACADFGAAEITWQVEAGTSYYIRVSGVDGTSGTYSLNIFCVDTNCQPDGDGTSRLTPIVAGDGTFTGDLADNPSSLFDPSLCSGGGRIEEWYCYVAPCDGIVTVTTCLPGTQFDTALSAFLGFSGVEVGCNNDAGGDFDPACALGMSTSNAKSTMSWFATAGIGYHVRVSVRNDDFSVSGGFGTQYEIQFSCQGPPDNDLCVNAEPIACNSSVTIDNRTATTDVDDPSFSCHADGPGAQPAGSVWYTFEATDTSVLISTCDTDDEDDRLNPRDSILAIYEGSCGSLSELACDQTSCLRWCEPTSISVICNGFSELRVDGLTVGSTYYIQLASAAQINNGTYTLSITCPIPPPPDVPCPSMATDENEPDCGLDPDGFPDDVTNGGCNSEPPVFTPISCGETVCGTAALNARTVFRDTDWYEITLDTETQLTWTVTAEFTVLLFLIRPDCESGDPSAPFIVGEPLEEVSISQCLPAGTYYLFVAPDVNFFANNVNEIECGAEYVATVTCETPCPTQGCCLLDGTCQELSEPECLAMSGTPQGAGTDCATANCPVICGPGAGDCFELNGNVGCDDTNCCETVCSIDAFCCENEWDTICVGLANQICAPRACCFESGECQELPFFECQSSGGTPHAIAMIQCGEISCEVPANDLCENAELIECNSSVTFDNSFATTSENDPALSCSFDGTSPGFGSLWFKFVATHADARFVLDHRLAGNDKSFIALYSVDEADPCNTLVEHWCGVGFDLQDVCVPGLTVGETYYVLSTMIEDNDRGIITLEIHCPCVPPIGACCFPDGSCFPRTESDCETQQGIYQGDNVSCSGSAPAATYESGALNMTLNQNVPPVSHIITVPDDGSVVGDVDVGIQLTHSWPGDLRVRVEHLGTTVQLIVQPGDPFDTPNDMAPGCSGSGYNIVLDDEGTGGPIEDSCAGMGGGMGPLQSPPNYVPNELLSAFDGMPAGGDWTITAEDVDLFSGGEGTFENWSLIITTPGESPCPSFGACCFGVSECELLTEVDCATAGGSYLGDDSECPLEGLERYRLHNHPDGNAAPPSYGLRLDGLLTGNGQHIYTFDFDDPQSAMFMDVDHNTGTIHIFGRTVGGRVQSGAFVDPELWNVDFTYAEGVGLVGGDGGFADLSIDTCPATGVNAGTISADDGSPGPIALVDTCGSNSFSFRFGDKNGEGHRGFDGLSGWGWLNHSGEPHVYDSDWLFTAERISSCECPPPDCDLNSDGTADGRDIEALVHALIDGPTVSQVCSGDFNQDGDLDMDDIADFIAEMLAQVP